MARGENRSANRRERGVIIKHCKRRPHAERFERRGIVREGPRKALTRERLKYLEPSQAIELSE